MDGFEIQPGELTLSLLRKPAGQIVLPVPCWNKVQAAAEVVEKVVQKGDPVYGVNTGFGKLAKVKIEPDKLGELQTNLVRSHACGVGPFANRSVSRLTLLLKIASLAQGYSGIQTDTLRLLLKFYNEDLLPAIPLKGSVGASGDLAPLAHLALPLIGEGQIWKREMVVPTQNVLDEHLLTPLQLAPKEGLALLNGTQFSTALALRALFQAEKAFAAALVAGAMSTDAARGSDSPFEPRIHAIRRQQGQMEVAEILHDLLQDSEIRASHLVDDDRVQDPYSLRCQPQVLGACLDQIRQVAKTLLAEANAVTDNPLVFPETGEILSGGNFHAEPVALAADQLSIALAEIGALSERRIALLVDTNFSGLPPFLTQDAGLNSGYMIPHVTAAALASENKTLAHPASVDSLPTSANQEDHVSMATFAARKAIDVAVNVSQIVSIELLCATQGLDFLRPMKSSEPIERAHAKVRAHVATYDHDRPHSGNIANIERLISDGAFLDFVPGLFAD